MSDARKIQDVALIVGGGPGISSSCARLFAESGMRVAVAARTPDKPVLQNLEKTHGVKRYACDASEPAAIAQLFQNVVADLGAPRQCVGVLNFMKMNGTQLKCFAFYSKVDACAPVRRAHACQTIFARIYGGSDHVTAQANFEAETHN